MPALCCCLQMFLNGPLTQYLIIFHLRCSSKLSRACCVSSNICWAQRWINGIWCAVYILQRHTNKTVHSWICWYLLAWIHIHIHITYHSTMSPISCTKLFNIIQKNALQVNNNNSEQGTRQINKYLFIKSCWEGYKYVNYSVEIDNERISSRVKGEKGDEGNPGLPGTPGMIENYLFWKINHMRLVQCVCI